MERISLIKRLVEDHAVVRRYLEELRAAQYEQRLRFFKNPTQWPVEEVREIVQKQYNQVQGIISMLEGAKEHAELEEEEMGPLVGPTLAEALAACHRELVQEMKRARRLDHKEKLTSTDQLVAKSYEIGYAIDRLHLLLESHMRREDAILELLLWVFEREAEAASRALKDAGFDFRPD
jgi:hypothetical protein